MEDTYVKEIELSRKLAREFEKYRWSFTSDTYRDLIAAYKELKRHYENQIEEGWM